MVIPRAVSSHVPDPNVAPEVAQHENNLVRRHNRCRAGHHGWNDHFAERESSHGFLRCVASNASTVGCEWIAKKRCLTRTGVTHNHKVVDSLSTTLAALSDPTRRAILVRLKAGPASVTELSEPFGVSQQAISKHLAYLERAELIRTRREGRQQIRELNPAPIREVADWAEEYRSYWEGAFSRLRVLVDRQAAGRQRRKRKP